MELRTESRIARVVVHARGAWVTRIVEPIETDAEEVDLSLPGITPRAEPGSLRAVVAAPRAVVSVRSTLVVPKERHEPGPSVERLRSLEHQIAQKTQLLEVFSSRVAAIHRLRPDPGLAARSKQDEVRQRVQDTLLTSALLDELTQEAQAGIVELDRALLRLNREREAAQLDDAQRSAEERMGQNHPRRRVVARLSGHGPIRGFAVSYAVPAARWWPLYTLRLENDRLASLWLEALVAQESGEDWSGVELSLSTADMIFDARLPELPSLRLGKARPKPRPGYRLAPEGLEAMFAGYDRSAMMISQSRTTIVHEELTMVAALGGAMPKGAGMRLPSAPEGFDDEGEVTREELEAPAEVLADLPEEVTMSAPPPAMAPARSMGMHDRPPAPAVARVSMSSERAKRRSVGKAEEGGGGPRGGAGAEALPLEPADAWLDFDALEILGPSRGRRRGRLERTQGAEWGGMEALRLESLQPGRPVTDPKESRGHFDHRYEAGGSVDVPSDGAPHRVPVASAEARTRFIFTSVPREAAEVYREAKLLNPFDAPLLKGPIDVYSEGAFLSTTNIESVDRGGELQVGIGVEERIRVARNARVEEDAQGLLGGTTAVDHDVSVEFRSSLGVAVEIEVRDRLPVTDDKNLEVKLLSERPAGAVYKQVELGAPMRGGRVWLVKLGPGEEGQLRYSYRLAFPSKQEISGGNRRE